jgi:glycosyltransferase-like protein
MNESLRIALLTYSTKPRGSVIHTLELARALRTLGHQPSVFALDKDGQGFGRTFPFATHSVPASSCEGGIDELIRQRIEEFVGYFERHGTDYDIFHAQDCIGANALAVLRQQGRIPHFVRTVHHVEAFESPYLRDCQDRSIRLPDRCLCVSQFWQEALWTDYGIRAERVFNGVDTLRFSPLPDGTEASLAASLNLTGGPIYLTVGGIEPRKNSIRLLQAFAQVLKQLPEAQLVIAGGATLFDYQPYRQAFLETAEKLGIRQGASLILPGVIAERDLPMLYRLADAFVFPSLKEGWGLVVLEAIATHLPLLTANQAPFTEFLNPDQALLIDPESVDAIATALLQIVQPSERQRLVENSRGICDRYTWIRSAQRHLAAYHSLLASSPARDPRVLC